MTVDREQVRQEALDLNALARQCTEDLGVQRALHKGAARHRDLLAELEQAERRAERAERSLIVVNEARDALELDLQQAEQREAALVEAAKKVADMPTAIVDSGAHERLRDALADFEQKQP